MKTKTMRRVNKLFAYLTLFFWTGFIIYDNPGPVAVVMACIFFLCLVFVMEFSNFLLGLFMMRKFRAKGLYWHSHRIQRIMCTHGVYYWVHLSLTNEYQKIYDQLVDESTKYENR